LSILIHYPYKKYKIKNWSKVKILIEDIINEHGKKPGSINFIFIDNSEIINLNYQYLKHNYATDVLCFILSDNIVLSGDIYIGIDTIKDNAKKYKVTLANELMRVIIHGTLHLCGFEDSNEEQRDIMKNMEDSWLIKAVKNYGIQL